MKYMIWTTLFPLIIWQTAFGDDLNPAYFEELAAQPLMVSYRIVTTHRNVASVRSFLYDEINALNARKDNLLLVDMEGYVDGKLYLEKHYRCNGEHTFAISVLGDGSKGPKNSQANFARNSQRAITDNEYYIKYLGIRGPHRIDADRIFQQWGLGDKQWWLDRRGAFAEAGSTLSPQGAETINGVACHVFQLNMDTIWVDQNDRRRILRHRVDWEPGVPKMDVTYSGYRDYGKFSLPWEMERTFYCHASLEPALKGTVAYRTHLQVESMVLGATRVPDAIFSEVPVPAGTLIFDIDTGEAMTFGNREKGQVNTAMLDEMGFRLPTRTVPWLTIALTVAGILVMFAVAVKLRRRLRR